MSPAESTAAQPPLPLPRLGGLVLGSRDPRRLYTWYRDAFAPGAPDADAAAAVAPVLALELNATFLIFEERDDVAEAAAEPGRVLFNIDVDDIRAVESRLNALGARWVRPVTEPDPDEPALLGTVADPDGNYPQVVQLLRR